MIDVDTINAIDSIDKVVVCTNHLTRVVDGCATNVEMTGGSQTTLRSVAVASTVKCVFNAAHITQ